MYLKMASEAHYLSGSLILTHVAISALFFPTDEEFHSSRSCDVSLMAPPLVVAQCLSRKHHATTFFFLPWCINT